MSDQHSSSSLSQALFGSSSSSKSSSSTGTTRSVFSQNVRTKTPLFEATPADERKQRREREGKQQQEKQQQRGAAAATKGLKKPSKKQRLRHAVDAHDQEDVRTVFVGNLPNNVRRQQVTQYFVDCGPVESARIRCQTLTKPQDGKDRGRSVRVLRKEFSEDSRVSAVAYVLFKDRSSVAKAVAKTGSVFLGHHISVTEENPNARSFHHATSLFLGNLAPDTSDEDVWALFLGHGVTQVKRVRLIRDKESSESKGFGYVELDAPGSCARAIALRGETVNGREVRITHVNKDKKVSKMQATRRDLRKSARKETVKQGKKQLQPQQNSNKKSKATSATTGGGGGGASGAGAPEATNQPSWMGSTANPRRKLPKELRQLVPSNVVLSKEKKKALLRGKLKQ